MLAAPGGALLTEKTDELAAAWELEGKAIEAGDVDAAVEANVTAWVDGPHRGPDVVPAAVRDAVRTMQRRNFDLTMDWPDEVWEADDELDPEAHERLDEIVAPTLVISGELDIDAIRIAGGPPARRRPGRPRGGVARRRPPAVDGAAGRLRGRGARLGGPRRGMSSPGAGRSGCMTRVVTPREFGGPEVLELHEVEVPEPGPGEVRLAVRAIAVNAIDWYHYDGVHTDDPADLLTYGYELAESSRPSARVSTGSRSAKT